MYRRASSGPEENPELYYSADDFIVGNTINVSVCPLGICMWEFVWVWVGCPAGLGRRTAPHSGAACASQECLPGWCCAVSTPPPPPRHTPPVHVLLCACGLASSLTMGPVQVLGRPVLLRSCDPFTRSFYQDVLGFEQPAPVPPPAVERATVEVRVVVLAHALGHCCSSVRPSSVRPGALLCPRHHVLPAFSLAWCTVDVDVRAY